MRACNVVYLGLLFAACADLQPSGTADMAAELEWIAQQTDENPRLNAHANRARARILLGRTPPHELTEWVQFTGNLGTELLRAGETQAAIDLFAAVLDTLAVHPERFDRDWRLGALDHLALSYLRLGEQENCLVMHSAARCLLPIRPNGVHIRPRGSQQAIRAYERVLAEAPGDYNSVWLLNLAHMTLGSHPVDTWRIPPEALEAGGSIQYFVDIAPRLGLDVMGLSGGVVMDDLNGDGWLDLMTSSWGLRDTLRYFEATGTGQYVEKTREAGLLGLYGGLNLVHADYDNDGDNDVLVLRGAWLSEGHPNSLLRNDGNGAFADVTVAAGVYSRHPTQTAAWSDIDRDGDLDLFVGNETNPEAGLHPSELFRNRGNGTFEEVAAELGAAVVGYVKAAVWGDYDNDGWPDLFVSRYLEPNVLLRNEGGVRFVNVTEEAGVSEPLDSFPAWFWDYNNDGWMDLFVSGWRATAGDVAKEYLGLEGEDEKPRLYRNRGDGSFADVTEAVDLDRLMYTMGSNYGDLDADGWLDFYVGTGDPNLRALMPNRMFRSIDGQRFEDVTAAGGFGHLQKGHGVAFGDLDHDGDQDVYQVMGGAFEGDVARNVLFENPGTGNAWLVLSLVGTNSNRSAIGARVMIDTDRGTWHRTVSTGGSFGSSPLRLEIGLGAATQIHLLSIQWPISTQPQVFEDLDLNQSIRITEGSPVVEPLPFVRVQLGAVQ